jgi:hypothetical protein
MVAGDFFLAGTYAANDIRSNQLKGDSAELGVPALPIILSGKPADLAFLGRGVFNARRHINQKSVHSVTPHSKPDFPFQLSKSSGVMGFGGIVMPLALRRLPRESISYHQRNDCDGHSLCEGPGI